MTQPRFKPNAALYRTNTYPNWCTLYLWWVHLVPVVGVEYNLHETVMGVDRPCITTADTPASVGGFRTEDFRLDQISSQMNYRELLA